MAATPFDPVLILLQIVALQSLYYVCLGTCLVTLHSIMSEPLSMDQVFSGSSVNFVSVTGNMNVMSILLASVGGAYVMSTVVDRARKCVDFTFTIYFVHVAICTMYEEFPLQWEWWVVNVFGSVAMASLGEFLCAQREMEDIPLYSSSTRK